MHEKFSKIISKLNPTTYKKNYTHDLVDFIPGVQGYFSIPKMINVISHINKIKKKITQSYQ